MGGDSVCVLLTDVTDLGAIDPATGKALFRFSWKPPGQIEPPDPIANVTSNPEALTGTASRTSRWDTTEETERPLYSISAPRSSWTPRSLWLPVPAWANHRST